jgi:hypothetical protein
MTRNLNKDDGFLQAILNNSWLLRSGSPPGAGGHWNHGATGPVMETGDGRGFNAQMLK